MISVGTVEDSQRGFRNFQFCEILRANCGHDPESADGFLGCTNHRFQKVLNILQGQSAREYLLTLIDTQNQSLALTELQPPRHSALSGNRLV